MSDKELVVVGMRFQDLSEIQLSKVKKVYLQREPENKANTNAIAVYTKHNQYLDVRLGYIRDKDLPLLDPTLWVPTVSGVRYRHQYEVTSTRKFYLLLRKINEVEDLVDCTSIGNKNPVYYDFDYITGTYATRTVDLTAPYLAGLSTVSSGRHSANVQVKPEHPGTAAQAALQQAYIQTKADEFLKNNLNQNTESNTMNTANMKDQFFREVNNVVFDATTGKMGVKGKDGIYVFTKNGISVNPITEMGFKMPAFAIRTPVDNLKRGDIIVGEGDPVFFSKSTEFGYEVVTSAGTIEQVGNVNNMFFGENTVLAVKSLFKDMMNGKGGTNPMMLMALSGGNLFGGTSTTGGNDQMQQLAMMSMFSGGGGLFGSKKKKSKKAKKVKVDMNYSTERPK